MSADFNSPELCDVVHKERINTPTPQGHTPTHENCPSCDAAQDEILRSDPDSLKKLKFSVAGKVWLGTMKPYLRDRSFYLLGQHVKHLSVFFGEIPLTKIHIGHIRNYQQQRKHNFEGKWKKECGPSIVNHETSALQSVLKLAGEWSKIEPHFKSLPLPRWKPPKVMSDEQEMLVFQIASQNPAWELAAWVASLTVNTSVAGVELRNIQLCHISMDTRIPTLIVDAETAKEGIRGRVVVLNGTAQQMMSKCIRRAAELGSYMPEHYLFPFRRAPGHWTPTKPATDSWMRRSFEGLREAAGIPWLTPHCFRHQHATLSYESGENEESIRLRMGHTSARMTQHYSSLRRETQKSAVDAIDQTKRFGAQSEKLLWMKTKRA